MERTIYYEKQSGDLCRMHSINGYFGFQKIDKSQFLHYCNEYDNMINGLKTQSMDGFSEGRCIISYILEKTDYKYLFLIPLNSYNGIRCSINIKHYNTILNNIKCFFEFNSSHVWTNKKINGQWYKIDSISGVNKIDEPTIKNNGYLLVIGDKMLYYEINYLMNMIIKDDDQFEIYGINLYYSLKITNLIHYFETEKYNIQLNILNIIKNKLSSYIKDNRDNKETHNLKKSIIKDILYILKFS
jgi:hypothetical protein